MVRSGWRRVWSGAPQGSVLGLTLFLIYGNDLLGGLNSEGKHFADDVKLYRKVTCPEDRENLQDDLCKLAEWSYNWMLEFDKERCKVIHIGKKNTCLK